MGGRVVSPTESHASETLSILDLCQVRPYSRLSACARAYFEIMHSPHLFRQCSPLAHTRLPSRPYGHAWHSPVYASRLRTLHLDGGRSRAVARRRQPLRDPARGTAGDPAALERPSRGRGTTTRSSPQTAAYLSHGVREVWTADEQARVIERWTTASEFPETLRNGITWIPDVALPSLRVTVEELFGPVT